MEKYTLGIDFGSLSARAVICRVRDGLILSQQETAYPHGVMTDVLPDGTKLGEGFFLQHPADYVFALENCVRGATEKAGVKKTEIIAMAIDFTGCTALPLDKDGRPLCDKFPSHPYAYVNMWKQRNTQREAGEIEKVISEHEPALLQGYGGHVAPEMLHCKMLKTSREDPEIFAQTDLYMEASDYMLLLLTGEIVRNTSMAAVKGLWRPDKGYPDYLEVLHPAFAHPEKTLLRGRMCRPFEKAGCLTAEMAEKLGLSAGIPVAGGHYDAHAATYALNIRGEGQALMSLGTSSGLVYAAGHFENVEGAASALWGTILPQHYSYASGQPAFGDTLGWFVEHGVSADTRKAAEKESMNIHAYLTREAEKLSPGETGLLALDWWNGNRSCLQNGDLSGMLMGMTLTTTSVHIYRGLLEGVSFGMRRMVDSYREKGFDFRVLCACGGIAFKNPLLVQMLSDITHLPVRMSKNVPAPAVGACMLAAVAAGEYNSIYDAMDKMHCLSEGMVYPDEARGQAYDRLYEEYLTLHDVFGRGVNPVMMKLRRIAREEKR
ncbi:MAG: ribulokinase [Clostridia bacterium]|nr:ribulokinase [Clostridia bacterium]